MIKPRNFGWWPNSASDSPLVYSTDNVISGSIDDEIRPVYYPPMRIYDQEGTSSCVANAIVGALSCRACYMLHSKKEEDSTVDQTSLLLHMITYNPSRLQLYYPARKFHSDIVTDSGTFIKTGAMAVRKYGLVHEFDWPFDASKVNVQPPLDILMRATDCQGIEYYEIPDNDLTLGIKRCLRDGFQPVFGAWLASDFMDYKDGIYHNPNGDSSQRYGHAMYCNGWGYDDNNEEYYDIVSSWGYDWGINGTARVDRSFIEKIVEPTIFYDLPS